MSTLRPRLAIKRVTEFVLFVYLAVVMTFFQLETGLICQLAAKLRSTDRIWPSLAGFAVFAVSFFAVVLITLWPRYVLRSQAVLGSMIYVAAFSVAAASGISVRLHLAPAVSCQSVATWPPDRAQSLAIAYATVFAASLFVAILNLITPQKADYSDARLKVDAYLAILPGPATSDQEHRAQRVPPLKTVSDALKKAYDSFEKALGSETSPAYRNFVTAEFVQPIKTLHEFSTEIDEDHPEEFLKRIGYRDRGLAPLDDVTKGCEAQRRIATAWKRPVS